MSAPPQIPSRKTVLTRSRLRWAGVRPGHVGVAMRLVDLALIFMLALVAHRLALDTVTLSPLFWFAVACASLVALDLFAAAEVYRPRYLGSFLTQGRRLAAA